MTQCWKRENHVQPVYIYITRMRYLLDYIYVFSPVFCFCILALSQVEDIELVSIKMFSSEKCVNLKCVKCVCAACALQNLQHEKVRKKLKIPEMVENELVDGITNSKRVGADHFYLLIFFFCFLGLMLWQCVNKTSKSACKSYYVEAGKNMLVCKLTIFKQAMCIQVTAEVA